MHEDTIDPALEDGGWREPPHRMVDEEGVGPKGVSLVARDERLACRVTTRGMALAFAQPQDWIEAIREQVVDAHLGTGLAHGLHGQLPQVLAQAALASRAVDDEHTREAALWRAPPFW